ncbi:hypothetical protein Rhopal_007443-T1 [Rhodotorula paludigena]|uniref:Uncharacterized protein n=1 Tax=Rhodotorula paludigena TaxID=86838 RepID=A0AAV5GP48_9BASI|nr:hypothetical protein Rhopal_007441-T1 [Rhodotorula paludigena]GJN94368.1 hypothetical protein Rhopal_007443-T1 [Rhodotorula paludigena]
MSPSPAAAQNGQFGATNNDIQVNSFFDVEAFINNFCASGPTTAPVSTTAVSTVSAGYPWVTTGAPGSTPFPTPLNLAPISPHDSASNYYGSPASSYGNQANYGAPASTLYAGHASAVTSTTDSSNWTASSFASMGDTGGNSASRSSTSAASTLRNAPIRATRASETRGSSNTAGWGGTPIINVQKLAKRLAEHVNESERNIITFLGNKKTGGRHHGSKVDEALMQVEVAASHLEYCEKELEKAEAAQEEFQGRVSMQEASLRRATRKFKALESTFCRTYENTVLSHLIHS